MQSTATLILNEQHISNIFRRKRAELFNRSENDVMKLAKTGCEKNPKTHFPKHPERDRNFLGCFRYFKIVQPTLQCHLLLFVFPASRTRNKRSLIKSLLFVSVLNGLTVVSFGICVFSALRALGNKKFRSGMTLVTRLAILKALKSAQIYHSTQAEKKFVIFCRYLLLIFFSQLVSSTCSLKILNVFL